MKHIEEYVKNGGVKCPYCGSYDLQGGQIDMAENNAWQEMTCGDCNRHWDDVYTLTGIIEDQDEVEEAANKEERE